MRSTTVLNISNDSISSLIWRPDIIYPLQFFFVSTWKGCMTTGLDWTFFYETPFCLALSFTRVKFFDNQEHGFLNTHSLLHRLLGAPRLTILFE